MARLPRLVLPGQPHHLIQHGHNRQPVFLDDEDRRAWHAGVSRWRGRDNCNDHSIGIELEGLEGRTFESVQYRRLAHLLRQIGRVLPLREVVGHEHVAPGRKRDPGPGFDAARLRRRLRGSGLVLAWPAP